MNERETHENFGRELGVQIIPVLDLYKGDVVRGVGGRRHEYQPIQSLLSKNHAPTTVLDALLGRFSFQATYVADLDGVIDGRPDIPTIQELAHRPVKLIVDAGVKEISDAQRLANAGVAHIVAGTETLRGSTLLKNLINMFSSQRITFSMDMKGGVPIVSAEEWTNLKAEEIVAAAAEVGATQFILLDLADVGEGNGLSTLRLLERIKRRLPDCWFAVGGGVRNNDDLFAAEQAGADAVLIASALHDGRIIPEHIRARTTSELIGP